MIGAGRIDESMIDVVTEPYLAKRSITAPSCAAWPRISHSRTECSTFTLSKQPAGPFIWRDSMHEPRQSHIAETCRVLLVPGIGNSGPTHWQSHWESEHASYARVHQEDWDHPVCADWVAALECAAQRAAPNPLLVAHSLGCLAVAHWLAQTSISVAGALLVAIPDPDRASFPAQAKGFAPIPGNQLPCPSIVVASADDPYSYIAFAQQCAKAWKSRLINIGRAGHINAASGLGRWEQGHRMLRSLLAGS